MINSVSNPMSDLSVKATRGMFWSLAENLGLQSIQLLLSIILARLLLPEQFGLIGMLLLFTALAQSLIESGFGSALIQKKDASQLDACSVFYFNLLIGAVLTSLLYGAAPLIAHFYRQPLLIPLTQFLSLNVIINALALVPSVMLTRRMDFKVLFKVSLISVVISGGVGVGLAVKGLGVWSLAIQMVLSTLIRAMLLWQASRWRPARMFSRESLASLFAFGSRMMLSGLLDAFFLHIYKVLIGRVYSAAEVGYYVRAETMQAAAIQPGGSALGRVIFPALSPLQDDRARLEQAMRKITTVAMFFQFPLMVGLIVVAQPLITLLMTERWAPSVPYFQLFCVVGLLYPLHVINLTVLLVKGRSDLFFRLELIKKLMMVVAIAITIRMGITALLWGQVATSVAAFFLNSYYPGRLVGYSAAQQIRDIYPFLIMSLLMGASMYFVGGVIDPALPQLLAQAVLGVSVYLFLTFTMRRPMIYEVVHLARRMIQVPVSS